MSKDTDTLPPQVDIWGSCVSRDTLDFIPGATVGAYVARQSAIVAMGPARQLPVPLDVLESDFQRRMLVGDMDADAGMRIGSACGSCVLIDLADERRGVWSFSDGTYLTNSVEAFRTGIEDWAPEMGARLVHFGTDEHFELWRHGFTSVSRRIAKSKKPVVLLDIAWASVFEGQSPPQGPLSLVNGVRRRTQRKVEHVFRVAKQEGSILAGVSRLRSAPSSPGDANVKVARTANKAYRRYIDEARKHADAVIVGAADTVRMNKSHKWGIGPYHYSDKDYERVGTELAKLFGWSSCPTDAVQ